MSIHQDISKDGKHKVTSDDWNPRIYIEERVCKGCGNWFFNDELIVRGDNSYCIDCLPENSA